jgi:hypothetical protein
MRDPSDLAANADFLAVFFGYNSEEQRRFGPSLSFMPGHLPGKSQQTTVQSQPQPEESTRETACSDKFPARRMHFDPKLCEVRAWRVTRMPAAMRGWQAMRACHLSPL